jgi:hypothetical protein
MRIERRYTKAGQSAYHMGWKMPWPVAGPYQWFAYTTPEDLARLAEEKNAKKNKGGGNAPNKEFTHGGQVGSPCGCIGCFDTFDHIQGQWQYSRKSAKGNLGTFHASDYNSLICGCDDGMGGPGSIVAGLCNPDNREPGPEPRRAPANIACFSGIGQLSPPSLGKRTTPVAFRVHVEDRGEPGGGQNAGQYSDVYRIEIWIPSGTETPESIADQACCDCPDGSLRAPNIDDGGDLIHGNLQIHPQTPNSQDGTCFNAAAWNT